MIGSSIVLSTSWHSYTLARDAWTFCITGIFILTMGCEGSNFISGENMSVFLFCSSNINSHNIILNALDIC